MTQATFHLNEEAFMEAVDAFNRETIIIVPPEDLKIFLQGYMDEYAMEEHQAGDNGNLRHFLSMTAGFEALREVEPIGFVDEDLVGFEALVKAYNGTRVIDRLIVSS